MIFSSSRSTADELRRTFSSKEFDMNLVKSSLPLMVAAALGLVACNTAPSLGGSSPSKPESSSPPNGSATASPASTCKESTNANGVACKICVDSSGTISYDDCGSGGAGGGTGAGGTGGTVAKCIPTTDPTNGAACQTCYAPDGSYIVTCAPPPPGCVDASGKSSCGTGGTAGGTGKGSGGTGGSDVKCVATTDPSTGAACKTCYAADGSVTSNSCSGGTGGTGGAGSGGTGGSDVKCVATTDPSTGAACKTCYAADGSITSNSCSGGAGGSDGSGGTSGSGATCVGAPNLETGQICKVCSDSASGTLLFVDCGPLTCPSAPSSTTAPPAK
jgi:hypothetical protein